MLHTEIQRMQSGCGMNDRGPEFTVGDGIPFAGLVVRQIVKRRGLGVVSGIYK
ncbi:hypothetical protein IMSAGC006_01684 [Muribaculaceae bacterium]|nr:hypothetical protein IMSAGC006_01684 [Muribaculaceae bacterium]